MKSNSAMPNRNISQLPFANQSSTPLLSQVELEDNQGYTIVRNTKNSRTRRPESNTRVFIPQLIQVVGLMEELNSSEILTRPCYFSKYGTVTKVAYYEKNSSLTQSTVPIAFITYQSQLEAALALVAMQNYKHNGGLQIYCNPGTARFCNKYLGGYICTNNQCIYLHHNKTSYRIYQETNNYQTDVHVLDAKIMLANNLSYFIQKLLDERLQTKKDTYNAGFQFCKVRQDDKDLKEEHKPIKFPAISAVFHNLIKEKIITQDAYDEVIKEVKKRMKAHNKLSHRSLATLSTEQEIQDNETSILKVKHEEAKKVKPDAENIDVSSCQIKQKNRKRNQLLNHQTSMVDLQCEQPRQEKKKKSKLSSKEKDAEQKRFKDEQNGLTALVHERIRQKYAKGNPKFSSLFDSKLDGTHSVNRIKEVLYSLIGDKKI